MSYIEKSEYLKNDITMKIRSWLFEKNISNNIKIIHSIKDKDRIIIYHLAKKIKFVLWKNNKSNFYNFIALLDLEEINLSNHSIKRYRQRSPKKNLELFSRSDKDVKKYLIKTFSRIYNKIENWTKVKSRIENWEKINVINYEWHQFVYYENEIWIKDIFTYFYYSEIKKLENALLKSIKNEMYEEKY